MRCSTTRRASAPTGRSASARPSEWSISPRPCRGRATLPNNDVEYALTWLKKHSSKSVRDGMTRYAIPNEHALGVRMADIQKLGKELGPDHALALELWKTGVYEARMLC